MTEYMTVATVLDEVETITFYPQEVQQTIVGAVRPPMEHQFPFRVRVTKSVENRRWKVTLIERGDDGNEYFDYPVEFYRKFTKAGAFRKARKLIRRGITAGGIV